MSLVRNPRNLAVIALFVFAAPYVLGTPRIADALPGAVTGPFRAYHGGVNRAAAEMRDGARLGRSVQAGLQDLLPGSSLMAGTGRALAAHR